MVTRKGSTKKGLDVKARRAVQQKERLDSRRRVLLIAQRCWCK